MVDSWMQLAAQGEYLPVAKRKSLTKKQYERIANAIRAVSVDTVYTPYETQAILWCTMKRLTESRGKQT